MSFIPQANPKLNYLAYQEEIDQAIHRVLRSGNYIIGEEVKKFESEFARFCGTAYAIGVGNGTDAIHLALRGLGIGRNDEVITVSNTAVATIAAIEQSGAMPVLVDIDEKTFTIDPLEIEKAISEKTKAIVAVHLFGHPADMDPIMDIARSNQLWVVEDCAQAHGAEYKGRRVGSIGDVSAFSFYPTKNLGAIGDGGMVLTNNRNLAEKIRLRSQYGWKSRDNSLVPGINSRLDEVQASILRVKLAHLVDDNRGRRNIAGCYLKQLKSSGLLVLPVEKADTTHVYHQFVIRVTWKRDSLREHLQSNTIGTAIHYPVPVHKQTAYLNRIPIEGSLEVTEMFSTQIVSLPIFPGLSDHEVSVVVEGINGWSDSVNQSGNRQNV